MTTFYIDRFVPHSLKYELIFFQRNPEIFNRASLLNIGYLETMKTSDEFDCIFFHDVDIYMEDGRAMYSCDFAPLHLAAYTRGHNYE